MGTFEFGFSSGALLKKPFEFALTKQRAGISCNEVRNKDLMQKQSDLFQPTGGSSTGAQLADASIEDGFLAEVQTTRAIDGQTPRILENELKTASYNESASVQARPPGAQTGPLFDTTPFTTSTDVPNTKPSDPRKDSQFGRVISHRYIVDQKIGSGAFGTIYKGRDIITNLKVAIKIEPASLKHPQLEYEAKVYQLLAGSPNIPNFHYFVREEHDCVLVIDLLGPSLEDLFNYCGRRFSLKTVILLADQMIQRIEYLHYKHFIHRDIKPDNFVVGLADVAGREGEIMNNTGKIYLIDFGLAKRYRRPGSLVHIPPKDRKNLTGTARYASINTHKGLEQSRRDDLESLGYVLVYFLKGQLPWQGLRAANRNDKYGRIFEKKYMTSPEVLCEGLPCEFVTYFQLVRGLRFEERPDYDVLRRLFRAIQVREHFRKDVLFDWTLKKMAENSGSSSLSGTIPADASSSQAFMTAPTSNIPYSSRPPVMRPQVPVYASPGQISAPIRPPQEIWRKEQDRTQELDRFRHPHVDRHHLPPERPGSFPPDQHPQRNSQPQQIQQGPRQVTLFKRNNQ